MNNKTLQAEIELTGPAAMALKAIAENELDLFGKILRISISGKGCEGPDYAIGPSFPHSDDSITTVDANGRGIPIYMDPFTAHFCKRLHIDLLQDELTGEVGPFITNKDQKEYQGKFWLKAPEKAPTFLLEDENEAL